MYRLIILFLLVLTSSAYGAKISSLNYKINGNKSLKEMLIKLDSFASKSKQLKSNYLLLPELITLDLLPISPREQDLPVLLNSIADQAVEYEQGLKQIALKNQVYLIGGSTFIHHRDGLINRAYFVKPNGEVETQDKNFPTPWEKKYGVIGATEIKSFESPDFKFVLLICYDSEFPSVSLKISDYKPEVIFVSSQTDDGLGMERVKRTSSARAIEHMAFVLLTGAVGDSSAPWHSYVGQNYLFTAQNKYFMNKELVGKASEELSVFEVEIDQLRKARADKSQIYPSRDERIKKAK